MKDVARRAYLLDFYGPLLTEKQRDAYEWYYQQDLSLGEISEVADVSRHAVFDLVSRTDAKLERFETALGLVAAREEREKRSAGLAAAFGRWMADNAACLEEEARAKLAALIERIEV
ncbi:MAG: hypothetical protein FWG28_04480 [Clostridiales bacterium]|nr:hypothetical protein [Clostridiales bacterium]